LTTTARGAASTFECRPIFFGVFSAKSTEKEAFFKKRAIVQLSALFTDHQFFINKKRLFYPKHLVL
jgi:hypothetical protein